MLGRTMAVLGKLINRQKGINKHRFRRFSVHLSDREMNTESSLSCHRSTTSLNKLSPQGVYAGFGLGYSQERGVWGPSGDSRDHDHRFSTIFLLLLESSTNFLSLPKETPYANVTRYSPRNFRCEFFKAEEVKINTSPHGEHVGSVQPR